MAVSDVLQKTACVTPKFASVFSRPSAALIDEPSFSHAWFLAVGLQPWYARREDHVVGVKWCQGAEAGWLCFGRSSRLLVGCCIESLAQTCFMDACHESSSGHVKQSRRGLQCSCLVSRNLAWSSSVGKHCRLLDGLMGCHSSRGNKQYFGVGQLSLRRPTIAGGGATSATQGWRPRN